MGSKILLYGAFFMGLIAAIFIVLVSIFFQIFGKLYEYLREKYGPKKKKSWQEKLMNQQKS